MTSRAHKWLLTLAVLFSATGLADATPRADTRRASKVLFKGVEMYSWRDHGEWKFSLVPGTNRTKIKDEVTSHSIAIVGIRRLKAKLAMLAEGEEVFWFNLRGEPFAFPPTTVIRELEQFCRDKNITLVTR